MWIRVFRLTIANSKAELRINIKEALFLPISVRKLLLEKEKLNSNGELIIFSEVSRSQEENKKNALLKLYKIMQDVFPKEIIVDEEQERIVMKMEQTYKRKVLIEKKFHSEKKQGRQKHKGLD